MNHLSLLSEQSVNKNQVVGGARASALGSPMHCEHPLGASEKSITEIMSDASVDTGLQLDEDREKGDDGNSSLNDDEMLSGSSSAKKKRRPRNADDVPMSFPQKLMDILSNDGNADIASWLPNGKGFMIHQKKRFAVEILPKYFKEAKFTSFTRKLNRWNFTRITRGTETGAYYHEYFQRGNLRLCMQMCCQNAKSIAVTKELQPTTTMSKLKQSPQIDLCPSNDSHLLGFGMGVGGTNLIYPGPIVNHGSQPFAAEHMYKLRQLEHQRQELMMQQQQHESDMMHANQLASLSLSRSRQQNLLSPLANSNEGPSLHQDAFKNSMIQRSNTSAYLAMIMSQEKLNNQVGSFGGFNNISPLDVQRQQANLIQSQQQQMDQYSQQRMYQHANIQQQQHQLSQLQLQLQLQLQQQQFQQPFHCFNPSTTGSVLNINQEPQEVDSPTSETGKPNKRTSSAA